MSKYTTSALFVWTAMCVIILIIYLSLFCDSAELFLATARMEEISTVNTYPIVGILAQEQSYYLEKVYKKENFTSYIAASYVKAIESVEARVVPIMIGKNRSYYEDLLKNINGVLFPGGSTYFNVSDGYADAGQHIFEIAQDFNEKGDYFPLFGVCLGFELLIILASGRGSKENRIDCLCHENMHLDFTQDFCTSKMFQNASDDVINILKQQQVTVNVHKFCIVDKNLYDYKLDDDWKPTSHSTCNGLKFIATIENKRYPFYGVQFHPEKPAFEWKKEKRIPHSENAIVANRHFYDFFVNECRKNLHSFKDKNSERNSLIYNYMPYYTGAVNSMFEQCYMFEPRNHLVSGRNSN